MYDLRLPLSNIKSTIKSYILTQNDFYGEHRKNVQMS